MNDKFIGSDRFALKISVSIIFGEMSKKIIGSWLKLIFFELIILEINRYRRGLETCPQAKTSKSGLAFFLFFRRVRATSMTQRRVENTRVHFWTFSPASVKETPWGLHEKLSVLRKTFALTIYFVHYDKLGIILD